MEDEVPMKIAALATPEAAERKLLELASAIEADHGRLKSRLRPMRGLKRDHTARVVIRGHAFVQNIRRGHYELGIDAPSHRRVAAAYTDLARVI